MYNMKRIVLIIASVFFGALVTIGLFSVFNHQDSQPERVIIHEPDTPVHLASSPFQGVPQVLPDFTLAADKTVHGVVHIKTEYRRKQSMYDYFFDWRDFFGDPYRNNDEPTYMAAGSGVIISSDGYVVTNNHVVENADRIDVTLNDKRTFQAEIIGNDPSTDLALIKIDAEGLPYIKMGNSDQVKIGEWVLAVGNPFNLTSTVTAGIVSAKARNINILRTPDNTSAIESFIQTDAVVNRGNSGGALVNTVGELVGINTAIASGTGYYAGYSFAIPVNIVKKVVDDLLDYGSVQRALIGVQIRNMDNELASELGLERIEGVYIAGVTENGSAREAGILTGDVITHIDNVKVNSTSELLEMIGQRRPGDEVDIVIKRNNESLLYTLTLKNALGTTEIIQKDDISVASVLGATFEPITEVEKEQLGIEYGLKVVALENGKLRSAGIREGFILMKIDRTPIRTLEALENSLKNVSGGVLLEGIYPNGIRAYYGVGI